MIHSLGHTGIVVGHSCKGNEQERDTVKKECDHLSLTECQRP